ncbi:DEAD/DEAH box helicase [Nostoc sp. KVJ3]|uniref:DEAD/DEAH box helicase n=1 Tax=Nostoc sp. KVJ3 TaxID=457945 RepID=UPI002238EB3A|nr:3'-5' exonuclease [Nostoc sp. KVJ3]
MLPHPLQQARDYTVAVNKMLEKDSLLVQQEGKYQGKLIIPYGYGVVFTNISRKDFEQSELPAVFESHLVICKDEMYEKVDVGEFQQRLWDLSAYQFGKTLTPHQIDRIRWHIFPELRISAKQLSLFELDTEATEESPQLQIPDILKIMDLQQEQLARSLGDGHRVIHGVAGSGKTMILAYRCQHLAQVSNKPILVLCFNVSLAAKLRQTIQDKNKVSRIKVRHFHGWCMDLLKKYDIPRPDSREYQGDAYVEELVQRVITAVDAKLIPAGTYGAVMLDEGHDFKPEWLKLIAQMVNPETNSLLILYDDAQNLYGEKRDKKFSFKSVGIQAQGRTTIFKLNYRNTAQVLGVAYEFAKEVMQPTETQDDDQQILVEPASAGRQGPKPDLIRLPSFKHEVDYLAQRVQQLHERDIPWNEIAIIYRSNFMGDRIYNDLQQAQIPIEWVNADSDSRNYHPAEQSIKLMTMHSSKGLEFPVVLIPGVGYM